MSLTVAIPDINSQVKLLKKFAARQLFVARQCRMHVSGTYVVKAFTAVVVVDRLFLCSRKFAD